MRREPEAVDSVARGAFRDFEHSGWKAVAQEYHDHFAALTSQAVISLLDAVAAGPGARLLDVCTGPGYAAAAAAERGAHATGLDFSGPMIRQAREHFRHISFLVGDAEQLPFAGESFQAVTTNFGILHLSRPEEFLREAYRVLRPGGRVAFTVWAPAEEAAAFSVILGALRDHGDSATALPEGPPFFRFSDATECRAVLGEAGFANPEVTWVPQLWTLPHADSLFEAVMNGTVRTGGMLRAQTPEALSAIRAAIRSAAEKYHTGGAYKFPMPAVLASATKPS